MAENSVTRTAEVRGLKIIPELVTHHLPLRPNDPAISEFNVAAQQWETFTFQQVYERSVQWAKAFTAAGLKKGDRVAILLPNSAENVFFDQGALLIGLVVVPLHLIGTPENSVYILRDSGAKLLVAMNQARWNAIQKAAEPDGLPDLEDVVFIEEERVSNNGKPKCYTLQEFLKLGESVEELPPLPTPEDLALLVYTSGTTGMPKGVMLTHRNIMTDVSSVLYNIAPEPWDVWLSFLPLSHMFERTTSYYIGLGMGNHVWFSRGINRILDDLKTVKPTIITSVPRIYEKVYAKIQERLRDKSAIAQLMFLEAVDSGWRRFAKQNKLEGEEPPKLRDSLLNSLFEKFVRKNIKEQFGGRLRVAVTGGAAINNKVIKTFIGLGLPIYQGYGLTETSPVLSVNPIGANHPDTVGPIFPDIEAKLSDKDELLIRGPQVMKGYWKLPEETAKVIDKDGWLSTGDLADLLPGRYCRIKGRLKEIIVTSNGEKVPPGDIEQAIELDPLFQQVMVVGEGRPFVSVIVVLEPEEWKKYAPSLNVKHNDIQALNSKPVRQALLKRIRAACKDVPQYGIPRAIWVSQEPWTIENGLMTPTMKIRRHILQKHLSKEIDKIYQDFGK
ncbi:MAG: long-chain fatty acid--CoA ligase [Burkholderiales bacterium]|nr:long-chain fatty acid--CoA ligase [Burkholderiales bacterium]